MDPGLLKRIRQSTTGIKLGRALFSGQMMSPYAIADTLRSLGLPIPANAPLDVLIAQQLLGGGAVSKEMRTALDIGAYATGDTQGAVMDLLKTSGVLNDQKVVQEIALGSDTYNMISTGGVNVMADLKTVMDVTSAFTVPSAEPQARNELNKQLVARAKIQSNAYIDNMSAYHSGAISIFGLMGKIAEGSPDYFSNYFPGMDIFFPPTYIRLITSSTSSDLFGTQHQTAYASQYVKTLMYTSHSFVESTIWNKIILPYLQGYQAMAVNQRAIQGISVQSLAVLSMLPPYIKMFSPDFNAVNLLKTYGITPYDLGENQIDDHISSNVDAVPQSAAITFNGVDYFTPNQHKKTDYSAQEQRLLNADRNGNIGYLLTDANTLKSLNSWGKPDWAGVMGDFEAVSPLRGATKTVSTDMGTQHQRCFNNYFSALSVLNKVRTDQYFSDIENVIRQYDILGTIQDVEDRHKTLLAKINARKLNGEALKNIASFFNTVPSNLVLKQYGSPGKPAVFALKH